MHKAFGHLVATGPFPVVFLVLGVLIIAGILGDTHPGFDNWTKGEAPFVNGFAGVLAIFMVAGFSFQGTEMVGVGARSHGRPAGRGDVSAPQPVGPGGTGR